MCVKQSVLQSRADIVNACAGSSFLIIVYIQQMFDDRAACVAASLSIPPSGDILDLYPALLFVCVCVFKAEVLTPL